MQIINQYISVSDSSNKGIGEMYLYGNITSEKWFDEDVTPNSILNALNGFNDVKEIQLHINSNGGSCTAGNAIVAVLDSYRRKNKNVKINAYIEGVAASMATGISSACDTVYMAENSLYMVHKPLIMAYGNADELQKSIELLDKVEETLISNYMRKFKGTEDELKQLLSDETWMNAEEAKEYGFVDEIISGVEIVACANGIKIKNELFDNKVSDLIKAKYPNQKIKKEDNKMQYDEKLKNYGIDESLFNSLNIESEKILNLVDVVKDKVIAEQPQQEFLSKDIAIEKLGCNDITADELLNYAKIGMNPEDTTEIKNKATKYEQILNATTEKALTYAIKAQGDNYNENLTRKFLGVLNYDEILTQIDRWQEEAKVTLNAGKRVSTIQDFKNQQEPEIYKQEQEKLNAYVF